MTVFPSTCDRCQVKTDTFKMSIFNTEMLCLDCIRKEQLHPMYKLAKKIELDHVKRGDLNFEGIGKPDDL